MAVGELTRQYLLQCGYPDDQISKFSGETRLLQDIGLFGDDADEELTLLKKKFDVNFSNFPFYKYFPGERGWDHFVLSFFGKTRWGDSVKRKYPPITLNMIEQSMRNRRWLFD